MSPNFDGYGLKLKDGDHSGPTFSNDNSNGGNKDGKKMQYSKDSESAFSLSTNAMWTS